MPKYTFVCSVCGLEEQKYVPRLVMEIPCCSCSSDKKSQMQRQPPKLNKSDKEETINKHFGTKQRPDQREIVEQRRDEYYWTVEVPRMVNSGTYSVETMLEMGWIYLDDKRQIQINTKPPHKR